MHTSLNKLGTVSDVVNSVRTFGVIIPFITTPSYIVFSTLWYTFQLYISDNLISNRIDYIYQDSNRMLTGVQGIPIGKRNGI